MNNFKKLIFHMNSRLEKQGPRISNKDPKNESAYELAMSGLRKRPIHSPTTIRTKKSTERSVLSGEDRRERSLLEGSNSQGRKLPESRRLHAIN